VECCQQGHFPTTQIEIEPLAPELENTVGAPGEPLGRRRAEAQDESRSQHLDRSSEERQAHEGLLLGRGAVAWRAPEDDVGDEHRTGRIRSVPLETDFFEHAVEELARASNEWLALEVFIAARRLADAHDMCFGVAVAERKIGGGALERAGIEARERGDDVIERLAGGGNGFGIVDGVAASDGVIPSTSNRVIPAKSGTHGWAWSAPARVIPSRGGFRHTPG
jgi:hypothetical protein